MKRLFISLTLIGLLALASCRSPQGNVNPLQMGKGRPTLVR